MLYQDVMQDVTLAAVMISVVNDSLINHELLLYSFY